MMSPARNPSATWRRQPELVVKLQLNFGDWATIAFFALAVTLGVYSAESERRPSGRATSFSSHGNSVRTAVAVLAPE
jgi:hypothetical protein